MSSPYASNEQQPNFLQKAMGMTGQVSGYLGYTQQFLGKKLANTVAGTLFRNSTFAAATAYVGFGLALYGFYSNLKGLFSGQGSKLGTLLSGLGLTVAIYAMGFVGPFAAMAWGTYLVAMAAIVAVTALIAWLFGSKPPPETVAMQNVNKKLTPAIWSAGPMAAVGLGTAALLFSWQKNSNPASVMSGLTVPGYVLSQTLARTSGTPPDFSLDPKKPTTLIEYGTGPNDPSKVMIVTPKGYDHGFPMFGITSFELFKNLQFTSSDSAPTSGCYIPFFKYVNGEATYNDAVVAGLTNGDKLLHSVLEGGLNTPESLSAVQLASASNKNCVDPNSVD